MSELRWRELQTWNAVHQIKGDIKTANIDIINWLGFS